MTTFPNAIQTFPTMVNIDTTDAPKVKAYQEAVENGDFITAETILQTIANAETKIISATLMNNIIDTCVALQKYYAEKYSPAYEVSASEPLGQAIGDFWFKVI